MNDTPRRALRPGLTLVELLIVVTVLGILAAIAVTRTRAITNEAYKTTLEADLRSLAMQQELFEKQNHRYGTLEDLSDFEASAGVTVEVGWSATNGFAATAVHAALPGTTCGYFIGEPPGDEAGPATTEGAITCD